MSKATTAGTRPAAAAAGCDPRQPATVSAPTEPFNRQKVTYCNSEGIVLTGITYKPDGPGPFPAIVWNHGSERDPESMRQFNVIAAIFVPAGYVLMAPVREGHSSSQGEYIVDTVVKERVSKGSAAADEMTVALLSGSQLADQLAGLDHLRKQPYVDFNRIAVAGCSYGGIQTLLAAEKDAGYRAAVAISPAALSWAGNGALRERLTLAVGGIRIPTFIIHAPAENILPGRVLTEEAERLGRPIQLKIFPRTGNSQTDGHCFGGQAPWASDALMFIAAAMGPP